MKLMILREHHGKRYFIIESMEELKKLCLSIVVGRFFCDNPYYPLEEREEPKFPDIGMTEEEVRNLPDTNALKSHILHMIGSYENAHSLWELEKKDIEKIKRCIKNKDVDLAYTIIYRRQYIEDETFELIDIETTYTY